MHIGALMIFEARPGLPPTLKRARRKVFFGLNADERATDVATLAQGIETSIAELLELAATGQALAALS